MIEKQPRYLLSLFRDNPDPCYVLDLSGKFVAVNEAALKLSGYTRDELLGTSFFPLMANEDINDAVTLFQLVAIEGLKGDMEVRIYSKKGESLELNVTAIPVKKNGQVTGIIGMVKDMTKRKQLETALVKTQTQLKNIFDSIEVCLWSVDLKNGDLQISSACEAIYGYSQTDFMNDPDLWRKLIFKEDRCSVEKRQKDLKQGITLKHEYRIHHTNGDIRWVYDYTVPVLDQKGSLIRLDGVITDVTERKQAEERLQSLAFEDSLTGLPNRRYVREQLRASIARAARKKKKVIVMFLDLDGFKHINDTLGHAKGDLLLQKMATRLSRSLKKDGTLARVGGDEFVVILEELTELEAERIAHKLLSSVSKPLKIKNQEFNITTSIGISYFPEHGNDYEILYKRADLAMYLAKEKGKNNVQIYNQELTNKSRQRFIIEQGMRKALKNNEFFLVYQPIVNVTTGQIIGTEALIRWNSPSGPLSPLDFIPIAEETGFITSIGEWVLRCACIENKRLHALGYTSLFVSVNLSFRQLEQNFTGIIENILTGTGLDARFLHIEITESTAMTNVDQAIKMLQKLSEMGVSISIDDFGTGYSSLSYLDKFPINTIKIDQTFIRRKQLAIIKAIIAMASSLNINIVAEGVEHDDEIKQLYELGCTEMQGYRFSKPVSSPELDKLLKSPNFPPVTI